MSSEIKANKWSPATGTAATLGDSSDTFTVPSGVTLDIASGATIDATGATITGWPAAIDNPPAFQAHRSSNQTISNDTMTKLECQTEDFDTASAYDNSTNYNFTVPSGEGGVYWLYMHFDYAADSNSNAEYGAGYIAVNAENNSTASFMNWWNLRSYPGRQMNLWVAGMRTLAAGDTVQFYVYGADMISPGNWTVQGSARRDTVVGGYKMLGIS